MENSVGLYVCYKFPKQKPIPCCHKVGEYGWKELRCLKRNSCKNPSYLRMRLEDYEMYKESIPNPYSKFN